MTLLASERQRPVPICIYVCRDDIVAMQNGNYNRPLHTANHYIYHEPFKRIT